MWEKKRGMEEEGAGVSRKVGQKKDEWYFGFGLNIHKKVCRPEQL